MQRFATTRPDLSPTVSNRDLNIYPPAEYTDTNTATSLHLALSRLGTLSDSIGPYCSTNPRGYKTISPTLLLLSHSATFIALQLSLVTVQSRCHVIL